MAIPSRRPLCRRCAEPAPGTHGWGQVSLSLVLLFASFSAGHIRGHTVLAGQVPHRTHSLFRDTRRASCARGLMAPFSNHLARGHTPCSMELALCPCAKPAARQIHCCHPGCDNPKHLCLPKSHRSLQFSDVPTNVVALCGSCGGLMPTSDITGLLHLSISLHQPEAGILVVEEEFVLSSRCMDGCLSTIVCWAQDTSLPPEQAEAPMCWRRPKPHAGHWAAQSQDVTSQHNLKLCQPHGSTQIHFINHRIVWV